jgi:hypothetical protein
VTSATDLEALWERLLPAGAGQRQFRSIRVPDTGKLAVHAAARIADGARALLFDIPVGSAPDAGFEASGLRLHRISTDDGQSMALLLEDATRRDLFSSLCSDIISFASAAEQDDGLSPVLDRLDAWRTFLRAIGGALGRSEIIGLMGELHVLEALVEIDPSLLSTWAAPMNGLHDFEFSGYALEVKATLGPGWRATINSLDQLDTRGLDRLDLAHVRLFESDAGSTLQDQIDRIEGLLSHRSTVRDFSNSLLQRGLAPDDQVARTALRACVEQVHAWTVEDEFPRLRREQLPSGIINATYQIDLRQLDAFAVPQDQMFEHFRRRGQ